jgi:hypothetical protein
MGMTPILVRRRLKDVSSPNLFVDVEISFPEEVSQYEWRCRFSLVGLDSPFAEAYGFDALQALQTALDAVATAIRKSGRRLTWEGAVDNGDSGFRRQVPIALGLAFAESIEAKIDQQIELFIEEKKTKIGD